MEASEMFSGPSQMGSDLLEGLKLVALDQKIPFKLYGRVVLPVDGFVFWVKAQLLKQAPFQPPQNGKPSLVSAEQLSDEEMAACTINVECSLHFTTDFRQEEAQNYAANRMVMTTRTEIQELREIAPGTMYIGEFEGMRFGFSSQTMRYLQAGLWHYTGFAVYPQMGPQIVDDILSWSPDLVVSNSLPAWLAIQRYAPPWQFWKPLPQMFPSFLVPDNEPPPYVAIHINPEGTRALASAPTIDSATQSHTQLASDTVRLTMTGLRNAAAQDVVDAVYDFCSNSGVLGLMSTLPIVRDEKSFQAETRTLVQKKVVDFEVSYLQHHMRDVARQVIRSAVPTLLLDGEKFSPASD